MRFAKKLSPKIARRLNFCLMAAGVLAFIAAVIIFCLTGDRGYTVTTFSMGSYVQQTVYGAESEEAARLAANAVAELEDLISWRKEESDIARLNELAGEEFVELDERTVRVLSACLEVCRESEGAFDITIAPVSRLWNFDDNPHLPDGAMIEKFVQKVDYSTISLPEDGTAALRKYDTALDLGAVGKGAACDEAIAAYAESGVDRAIVAVGGSVGVYGQKPFGKPWTIAVRDPAGDGSLGTLSIFDGFISTSGSYEKFFTEDGVTYHHILDPDTGYPAESGLVSVTVKGSSGALSDALSTACFVLGLEESLPLIEKFDAEAVFVTEKNEIFITAGLKEGFTLTADGYTIKELP